MLEKGILYLVPTPIGNLEDITLRALRILKEVDLIVCEDTRQTIKLLNNFQIKKPLLSFYTYNQSRRIPKIIEELENSKNLALVSDSGTPGISDPGYFLIKAAIENNIQVISLPGPNAVLTSLVASGLATNGFVFLGFLKRKPGKMRKELQRAGALGKTIVFYESPLRTKKTLSLCREVFPGGIKVVIARELTKKFEEFIRGSLDEVINRIKDREIKGEVVILIEPDENVKSKEIIDD
ncbi:MAG: 16S rRNA (cytidine(1402)-2'-O)-methyltransferase [Endomicrobiales bacterium]|nr:16S rRNA (cytidine(1402)-2'-O)-methyltransferase [Endomicrobiales bacterium]